MTQKKETSNSSVATSKSMKDPNRKNRKMKTENVSAEDTVESFNKERAISKKESRKLKKSRGVTEESSQDEETSNTTLFVSNLHHKLGYQAFMKHFAQYGKVKKCYISENHYGHSNKGFGFVTYESGKGVKKAMKVPHKMKGLVAEVQINRPKPDMSEKMARKRKLQEGTDDEPPRKKACLLLNHEVFVGSLPEDTSVKKVKKHFSQFGEVANVFEPKKLDGKGLKFFFVSFCEPSSLEAALEATEHKINKTQACLQLRKDGKNVEMPSVKKTPSKVVRNVDPVAYERTLYVGQLDYKTKLSAVLEHFSKYGKVAGLTMPRHPRKENESKGFALVELDTSIGFEKALKRKKHEIDDKILKVTPMEEPKARTEKKMINKAPTEKYELFVAEIPAILNDKALTIHFSRYGDLVSVNRPMRKNQRKVVGYAFVQFKTKEGMEAALADTNHKIAGEPIVVRKCENNVQEKAGIKNVKNGSTSHKSKKEEDDESDDDDE